MFLDTLFLFFFSLFFFFFFFFSSRRRHTRYIGDWSSDVCSSDLHALVLLRCQLLLGFDVHEGERREDRDGEQRRHRPVEIGRASCRERGVDLGGRRIIKKKKEET